jgi:hypothetical protein
VAILGAVKRRYFNILGRSKDLNLVAQWVPVVGPLTDASPMAHCFNNLPLRLAVVDWMSHGIKHVNL